MNGYCSHGIAWGVCVFPGCKGARRPPCNCHHARVEHDAAGKCEFCPCPGVSAVAHDASTCGGPESCRACAVADEHDATVARRAR